MFKIRTAKRDFKDSNGNPVKAGESFVLIELRPLFVSAAELKQVLAKLQK